MLRLKIIPKSDVLLDSSYKEMIVLYKERKYKDLLESIESLKNKTSIPIEFELKLLEIQGKCYYNLHKYMKATSSFHKAILLKDDINKEDLSSQNLLDSCISMNLFNLLNCKSIGFIIFFLYDCLHVKMPL